MGEKGPFESTSCREEGDWRGKLGAREVSRGLAGELTTPPGPQEQRQQGCKRCGFDPCVGKIPWRRAWQPTPVFLSGESHGQRNLADYSP